MVWIIPLPDWNRGQVLGGVRGIGVKLSDLVGWHGQTMSLYVLNRDRLSVPFLRHTMVQNPPESWQVTVPRWRGIKGVEKEHENNTGKTKSR